VGFAVTPGNALDVYVLYDEKLTMLGMEAGEGAVFPLEIGAYYLAYNPDEGSFGEKVLSSGVVD